MLTYLSLPGTAVLRFAGKLCGSRARALGEELAELRQRGVRTAIVDLRDCRSADSLGIQALAEVAGVMDLRVVLDGTAGAALTEGLERLAGEVPAVAVFNEPTAALGPLAEHARGVRAGARARKQGA